MDIDELRTFVVIARTSSFAVAARELNRTQPAISRRIAALEASCGTTLLERLPSGACLTAAGSALLPYAEAMLAAMADARSACKSTIEAPITPRLAIVGTLVGRELVRALETWRACNGGSSHVELMTANSTRISEMVLCGDADIGLRYHSDKNTAVTARGVGLEEMIAVVATSNHSLQSTTWVTFSSRRRTRDTLEEEVLQQLRAKTGTEPTIIECDSLMAQKALVEAGMGIGVMPVRFVRSDIEEGSLRAYPQVDLNVRVPICLITRRNGFVSSSLSSLVGALSAAFGSKPTNAKHPAMRTASTIPSACRHKYRIASAPE